MHAPMEAKKSVEVKPWVQRTPPRTKCSISPDEGSHDEIAMRWMTAHVRSPAAAPTSEIS